MILPDPASTEAVGEALAAVLRIGDVVALAGPLGAGKTSLARGVLAALGLRGEAASPSFPLVIAYPAEEVRVPLWHVDLYRLDGPAEVEELGLDEARQEAALLIEWPDRMGRRLPDDALRLDLAEAPSGGRRLTWQVPPAWEGRWPPPR